MDKIVNNNLPFRSLTWLLFAFITPCFASEPNAALCKNNTRCYFAESELAACQAVGNKLYALCVPTPSDGKICGELFSAYYGCMVGLGKTDVLVKGYLSLPQLSPCKFVASKLILYNLCSNVNLDKHTNLDVN